jgi:hypothetical protein
MPGAVLADFAPLGWSVVLLLAQVSPELPPGGRARRQKSRLTDSWAPIFPARSLVECKSSSKEHLPNFRRPGFNHYSAF